MTWAEEQSWESSWWGDCANTFGEEAKQVSYASRMGLAVVANGSGHWPVYDLEGRSVVDLGGGPVSMLLKCVNRGPCSVVDPLEVPYWVKARYVAVGITFDQRPAETLLTGRFDEAWLYNVLQHTQDPEKIVANAVGAAEVVRMFEWVDTPVAPGHPHTLRAVELDRWLCGRGTVEQMQGENGCFGPAYYGVFQGRA